jgi:ABC-type transport system involved in cytochrome c biogenesis permease component
MRMLMAGVLGTFVFLGAAIAFAGWRVRKLLRPADRPDSDKKTTSAPTTFAGSFLKQIQERQRSRWLQRNPARWLWAKAGPGSRSQIAWMSVVAAVWIGTLCLDLDSGGIVLIPPFIPLVLTVPMAMTSAASLRQEMEEGTLELLLVTPLETSQLVTARVLEAWSQFLPAVLLNLFLTGLASLRLESPPTQLAAIHLAGITSVIALPAIGIRYAVRRLHPLAGMLWSLLTAGILPFLIGLATVVSLSSGPTFPGFSDELSLAFWFGLGFGLTQFALSAVWGWLAARDLELRWYMFRPFQQRPG